MSFLKNCVWLACLAALFSNCQKTKGCLDPEATNFAVEVDKSCDSCCRYPLLQVNIGAIWGDEATAFSYSKTWTDALGQPFRIDTVAFYLSDFQLVNSSTGTATGVMDSVRLVIFPDTTGRWTRRDVAIVRPTVTTYNIGSMLVKGEYDRLRFKVGLLPPATSAIPTRAPSGYPLRPQPEVMWDSTSQQFFFLKMKLRSDTASATAATVLTWPAKEPPVEVVLDFPGKKSWKRGISPVALMVVDYAKWFEGVDVKASDADILTKIRGNMGGSFRLK